ncbi:helix-turn-helix domain-containing protein [Pseudonocardia oroxyli]|uniref:PucR C-terminal helix-turn-helix domain-containing protein n=1 Tax=Pseudonocardia oroxyli TaxID=366584 RepID=A0A1G7MXH5_PSEOR|nr:helix-turn-helix domain-containing protein [Pseudonocardia oroxyli]SDF66454.1 PucR C-terminal helix-turn-helix domain-containing protein [Pseudonocardia oroxyli]
MDRPWSRVPAATGAALRPAVVGAAEAIIVAVQAEVPDYQLPLQGNFGLRLTQGVAVALDQFVGLLGSDTDLPDTRMYAELGRVEHRHGRTLAALQTAYQIGTRTIWQTIGDSAAATEQPPKVIFALAEALFSYVEQLSAASVAGWAEEEAMRAGSVQARRVAVVEAMLAQPPVEPAELERLASSAGWTVPAKVAALVIEGAVEVASRIPGAVATDLAPAGVAFVPAVREDWVDVVTTAVRDRCAVLGPPVPATRARRSAARAQTAWPVHAAGLLGETGLLRSDAHLVALLLAGSAELAADLRERVEEPLRELPAGAAARSVETLRAWLDAHGDVTATAAALHVHPQTVRYRLASLRDAYGESLDTPEGRLELALGLRAL